QRRALAQRLARLALAGALAVTALLAASRPTRAAVLSRAATITTLSRDPSVVYRLHFCRAALALLRDRPRAGVGWEHFGLLYPKYRSAPTAEVESDLVPTMVHSGPLQTAVSAGVPAWILQVLFLVAVGAAVLRRVRSEADGPQRLLGAAFLASLAAYVVQDFSGWPHVALGALAFAIWGLGVTWSQARQVAPVKRGIRALSAVAAAVALGGALLFADTWNRIRAERMMFRAERLDAR